MAELTQPLTRGVYTEPYLGSDGYPTAVAVGSDGRVVYRARILPGQARETGRMLRGMLEREDPPGQAAA